MLFSSFQDVSLLLAASSSSSSSSSPLADVIVRSFFYRDYSLLDQPHTNVSIMQTQRIVHALHAHMRHK